MSKPLWEPPRLRTGNETLEEERHATWLELFYDLIFVVAVAELGHTFGKHVTWLGFLQFVGLFIPVWWCWVGATFYATRFDTDDLGHRVLTLMQMFVVAIMAVTVHDGFGETSVGFALCYIVVRGILIFKYLRAGYHVPIARPLTTVFAIGFSLSVALWLLSIAVPPPWRFVLWAIAMGIDLATPIVAGRSFQQVPPHMAHVSERLGLFMIIVLGESVVGVVRGISGQELGLFAGETGLLGLMIAFSLWWIYFDSVDASPLESYRQGQFISGVIWLYTHLLLLIGLAATGVGVYHLIFSEPNLPLHTAERWLMSGALALCFLALGILHLITVSWGHPRQRTLIASIRFGTAAFLLVLAIAGTRLHPVTLILILAIVSVGQVILDLLIKPRP